ncbi:MATE family efflux transporter [Photobacterium makurazakiensis]|uniref:MATE family efflux transporter n=1 Tax=Photobacterium makurazakiensis TaxID=2910234 RepID=UPI003D109530
MEIYKKILFLAAPLALHSVLFSSLGFIDTFMLSKLGGETVAAAGIGARTLWFAMNVLIGVGGATAIFCSQYYGAKNSGKINQSVHISLLHSLLFSLLLIPTIYFGAEFISTLMSKDTVVIALAASYMKITAFILLISAFSVIWGAAIRALQKPKVMLYLFLVEMLINIIFNCLLIYGWWGFPELGLVGAAWATLIARISSTLLLFIYVHAELPILSVSLTGFSKVLPWAENKRFLQISLPIIAGEIIWSGGIFIYHMIYGNISTTALAAISILAPIEVMTSSICWGAAAAVGILIGEKIGAQQQHALKEYIKAAFVAALSLGLILVATLWLSRHLIVGLFNGIEQEVIEMLHLLFPFILLSIILRAITMTAMSGVLKSGGDTKFTMKLDFIAQWFGAVPLSLIAAFWFEWPIQLVFSMVLLEEALKLIPVIYRIKSGKWIQNLAKESQATV